MWKDAAISPAKLLKSLHRTWVDGWSESNYASHWNSMESPEKIVLDIYEIFLNFANTHRIAMPDLEKSEVRSMMMELSGQNGYEVSNSSAGKFFRLFVEEMGWATRPKNENQLSSLLGPSPFPFLPQKDKEAMVAYAAQIKELRLRVAAGAYTIEKPTHKI